MLKIVPIDKINIKKSVNYAYLDADKIQLPLLIRYWKQADYFYPFGLSKLKNPNKVGKKKLSKYFKDQKFSQIDKNKHQYYFQTKN
ncbi:MAG: tRNA lysidine(34) synthetase TilS C-terminal domain-containing protein [Chitinophagales bacterium]